MVSQLTAYAEILCLLMTLFSAGASARNDIFLQSACSLKFVQVKDGVVIADGTYGDVRPRKSIKKNRKNSILNTFPQKSPPRVSS
uniref:Putative secreted peptide n=1 Tax=Anopheles braziliensis TaxID=58242 RepID=A0A2M3ZSW0_9DIPT